MSEDKRKKRPLYIRYAGPVLLETPLLNKGSAFTEEERRAFNLEGLLPYRIETIEEQAARAYQQFSMFEHRLDKHIYLRNIQDTNETLYMRLLVDHLEEMMPIIYTPTVGKACQLFSQIYRRKRGLFVTYPHRDRVEEILQNATKQNVKIIVVTDSERILGLGDQGIGGMGIPIGKLSLYSACGGISPAYTLPVTLDVGTENEELLNDPLYMGWRHRRVRGDDYFDFVDRFIEAVTERWPNVLIQFEDFAQATATPLLEKYKDRVCCFNDDIQGTASVTVGTLLAACHAQGTSIRDQRVVFVGAGSAGCGIAGQIVEHMKQEGLSEKEALDRVYLTNSKGVLVAGMEGLRDFQERFAKQPEQIAQWGLGDRRPDLADIVRQTGATILIGVSGQPGLITEAAVKAMLANCERPIVLPLSNPTSRVEALPEDVIRWSEGRAIVATGSPFEPVTYNGRQHEIAQCNNAYIFPGVGLGVLAAGARRVTPGMMMRASESLAATSPLVRGSGSALLPPLRDIRSVSKQIAFDVAMQAMNEGVAPKVEEAALRESIDRNFWEPEYREYRRTSF
jgi:malate dehydrogenase (oxaloacetate-decarboxylating)